MIDEKLMPEQAEVWRKECPSPRKTFPLTREQTAYRKSSYMDIVLSLTGESEEFRVC